MAVNCICSTAFCESAVLREKPAQAFSGLNPLSFAALSSSPEGRANPLSLLPMVAASSPEGGAFLHLPASTNKAPPSGELARRKP